MASLQQEYVFASVLTFLGTLGLLSNALQLLSQFRKRQLTLLEKTLFSLGIADAIGAISFILYGIWNILLTSRTTELDFTLYFGLGINIATGASIVHVVFIAQQRFFAVLFPLNVKTNFFGRHLIFCLGLAWIFSCFYGTVCPILIKSYMKINSYFILLFGAVLVVLYSCICCTVDRKRDLSISGAFLKRQKMVSRHCALVTIAFIASFFPHAVQTLFFPYSDTLAEIGALFAAANPVLDSTIYFFSNRSRPKRLLKSFVSPNLCPLTERR